MRARSRSARIHHRVAGGISRLVPVRGPLPHISVHIKKAPWVGRILPHISGLFKIVPSLARHPNYNSHSNWQLSYPMSTPWSYPHGRHIPIAIRWATHRPSPLAIGLLPALAWLTGCKTQPPPSNLLSRPGGCHCRRVKFTWV